MDVKDLIAYLEDTAPPSLAASWDKSGVQVASSAPQVQTLCVALDPTPDIVQQAVDLGAEFLLCHHPLTLKPLLPTKIDAYHQVLTLALGHELWVYSAHTSLDANPQGPVNWLARHFGLLETRVLAVTQTQVQTLVRLLHPMDGDMLEHWAEYQNQDDPQGLEFLLWPEELNNFRSSLGQAKYVELPMPQIKRDFGFGCLGILPLDLQWSDFSQQLGQVLPGPWRRVGLAPEKVRTIAYCPGSGSDFAAQAFAQGADVFLTGDLKYHQAQDLEHQGLTLDVGHFSLEEAMMRIWSQELAQDLVAQQVQVTFLPGHDPFIHHCPEQALDI